MKTKVEEVEKNKVLLKVEVPLTDVKNSIAKAYRKISGQLNIPGFRRGKIPPRVIDAQFGKGPVLQEALREMLPLYYLKAIRAAGLKPIVTPKIEVVQIKEDKPLLFNAQIELKPKVDLDYKNMKVKKIPTKVSKEEVEEQLTSLRSRFARLEVAKKRALKKGDFALINFEGKVGGKVYEGGSAQDYLLEIGSNMFPPTFEEKLIGARQGEIIDILVDVPSWYHRPEIAGKKVAYRVMVKEVKRKVLPELNDEFTKETSEFDTLKDLKADTKKKMQALKESEAEAQLKLDILDELVQKTKVELPKTMVEERVEDRIDDLKEKLKDRGFTWEDYLSQANTKEEDLKKSFQEEAEKSIKIRLALETVAEKERLEVGPKELDNEIRIVARKEGKSFEDFKKQAHEEGYIEALKEDILVKKAIDVLATKVKVVKEDTQKKAKDAKEDTKKKAKAVKEYAKKKVKVVKEVAKKDAKKKAK